MKMRRVVGAPVSVGGAAVARRYQGLGGWRVIRRKLTSYMQVRLD